MGAVLCGLWLISQGASGAQDRVRPAAPDRPIVHLHRIVLLSPSSAPPDALASELIAQARTVHTQGKSRKGLLTLFAPTPTPSAGRPPVRTARPALEREPSIPELKAVAAALFHDALSDRLHARFHAIMVTDAEVQAACTALHMTGPEAESSAGAQKLREQVDGDAVLAPEIREIQVVDGKSRVVIVRAVVRIVSLRTASHPPLRSDRRATGPVPEDSVPLPAMFPVAGAAAVGHVMFRKAYQDTVAHQVVLAVQQAALLAAHTLWTGEVDPFATPGVRLAVAPVAAPTSADALAFSATGRRVMPNLVRGLPADVSGRFDPDLLPLPESEVRAADRSLQDLEALHIAPEALWKGEDEPDLPRVRALARRVGVQYILMAHVTDAELETGPRSDDSVGAEPSAVQTGAAAAAGGAQARSADPKPSGGAAQDLEARAEVVGALVRVSDGKILWRDRANATMSAHASGVDVASGERQVVEDAIHFALVQLQRRYSEYRAHFER